MIRLDEQIGHAPWWSDSNQVMSGALPVAYFVPSDSRSPEYYLMPDKSSQQPKYCKEPQKSL